MEKLFTVLGDLTSEEVTEVEKLLATRPELKQEVESLEQTLALFPLGLPEVELPSNLGDRLLQGAVAGESEKKSRKKLILLTVIGSITAAILATLSISNYRLQQQVATNQEIIAVLAQKSKDLLALKGTELIPI
jgi:anti-sigma factor RsiW